eukprot:COSAG05_NODE_12054_length_485_cov_1.051813_1_plen_51_part_01
MVPVSCAGFARLSVAPILVTTGSVAATIASRAQSARHGLVVASYWYHRPHL